MQGSLHLDLAAADLLLLHVLIRQPKLADAWVDKKIDGKVTVGDVKVAAMNPSDENWVLLDAILLFSHGIKRTSLWTTAKFSVQSLFYMLNYEDGVRDLIRIIAYGEERMEFP